MMKKLLVFSSIFLFSCVTPTIHNDLVKQNEFNKNRANEKDLKNLKLQNEIIELKNSVRLAQENLKKIKEDSINNGQAYKSLNSKYQDLSEAYDLLSSKSSRFMSEKAKETKRLIEKLDDSQMKLISKKEELKSLSDSIQFQKDMLTKANQELDYRSLRVKELESIINKKDSMVTALKARISSALSGLEGNGLTIEKRNGKVYLSLEESLLFASGKYDVNNEGITMTPWFQFDNITGGSSSFDTGYDPTRRRRRMVLFNTLEYSNTFTLNNVGTPLLLEIVDVTKDDDRVATIGK